MNSIKVLHDESIAKYTTIKIGGVAKLMFFPHNIEELKNVIKEYPQIPILGGGSNLLVSNRSYDAILNMREYDHQMRNDGDGCFLVGAGVRNQQLIKFINQYGYGGIEYLYSVPGLLGGAIVMNAGPGAKTGCSISDYVKKVHVLDRAGQEYTFSREECAFSHRRSVFLHNNDYIITQVEFQFIPMDSAVSSQKIHERMEFCKKTQDNSAPNFGSVYKISNYKILSAIKAIQYGNKKGVHFSKKTANWILNSGGADAYTETVKLMKRVQFLHKILGKKCEIEVIIWK